MNKIPSKLDYLRGLLRGMELNGSQKNVVIEQIIEILDMIYDEIRDRRVEYREFSALPSVSGKDLEESDTYKDTTIKKDSFTTPTGMADVWYDESVNVSRRPEASTYTNKKVPIYNTKTVMEKICKHCGTYIRAELSYDESKRVKIQCPRCKHFILPEDNDFYEPVREKKFSWDDLEEKKQAELSYYDDEEYGEMDDVASILGEHHPYSIDTAHNLSLKDSQVHRPLNKPHEPLFTSSEEEPEEKTERQAPRMSYEEYLKAYTQEENEGIEQDHSDHDDHESDYITPKKIPYGENFNLSFQEERKDLHQEEPQDLNRDKYPRGSFFAAQEEERVSEHFQDEAHFVMQDSKAKEYAYQRQEQGSEPGMHAAQDFARRSVQVPQPFAHEPQQVQEHFAHEPMQAQQQQDQYAQEESRTQSVSMFASHSLEPDSQSLMQEDYAPMSQSFTEEVPRDPHGFLQEQPVQAPLNFAQEALHETQSFMKEPVQAPNIASNLNKEAEMERKQVDSFTKEESIQQLEDEMLFQESSVAASAYQAPESKDFASLTMGAGDDTSAFSKNPEQTGFEQMKQTVVPETESFHQREASQLNFNTIGDAIDNLAAAFLGDLSVSASSQGAAPGNGIEQGFYGNGNFMDDYERSKEEVPKKENGKIFSRFFKK